MQILVVAAANIYFSPVHLPLATSFPCAIFPFKHFLGSYLLPVFKTARRKLKLISFSFFLKNTQREIKSCLRKGIKVKLLKNLCKIKHLLIVLRSMKGTAKTYGRKRTVFDYKFYIVWYYVCGGRRGRGQLAGGNGLVCLSQLLRQLAPSFSFIHNYFIGFFCKKKKKGEGISIPFNFLFPSFCSILTLFFPHFFSTLNLL